MGRGETAEEGPEKGDEADHSGATTLSFCPHNLFELALTGIQTPQVFLRDGMDNSSKLGCY